MKKIISLCLVTVFLIVTFNGCGSPAGSSSSGGSAATTRQAQASGAEEVLILGLVSPLTGSGAASGAVQANAVKMAVNEINAAGGIDGRIQIKLVSEDDEGVPAKSVTVTQKLVSQDGIHVMIGALNSSCTLADMEITAKAGIPQITPSSSAAAIVEQGNEFIFRNTATDTTHVKTLYKYITEKLGGAKVAVLYESSDFGTGAHTILQNQAADYGIDIILSEVYNSGEKDFSVQLTKIKDAQPDAIILWGYYTEAALICQQVQQYGVDIPMVGTGYNSPKLIELGGDAVNGLIFTTAFTEANQDPKVQAFDEKYKALYNMSYDQNAPQAYDSVYIIADAVTRAGSLDSVAIRDAIRATKDFDGVAGITNFAENGEVIKDLMVVQIVDGAHTLAEN